MRVAHFISTIDLSKGGVVRAVLDLAHTLRTGGHESWIVTQEVVGEFPQSTETGSGGRIVELGRAGRRGGRLSPEQVTMVRRELAECDVAHVHAIWQPMHVDIAAQLRTLGKPMVLSTHGMLDEYTMGMKPLKKRVFLALAGRRMIETANVVHCTSATELEESRRWFGAARDRGVVVPLALDVQPFDDPVGPEVARARFGLGDRRVILFLGRLHPIKGLPHLIDAVAGLPPEHSDALLVLAGGADDPRFVDGLKSRSERLGLSDRVVFPGMVGGREKISLLRAASVFVLPSSHENFGLVAPEALMASVPVVVTYGVSVWRELVEAGGAMACAQVTDEIRSCIQRVLDDPDVGRSMGEAGAAWVRRALAPGAVRSKYLELYERASASTIPSGLRQCERAAAE